jgi:hypothetical protein
VERDHDRFAVRTRFFHHRIGNALRNLALLIGRTALQHGYLNKRHMNTSSRTSAISFQQVLSAGFINAFLYGRHVPQGLKPAFSQALNGTAEAVPHPKPIHETGSAYSAVTDS